MIEDYKFGKIVIDGKSFSNDIEVDWQGNVEEWWREEGHEVCLKDLRRALNKNPEVLVIGTGKSGMVEIEESVLNNLEDKNIDFVYSKTPKAVKIFNKKQKEGRRVIGLFHLTC